MSEEVKKKELFWVEKIEKALNTLILGEGKEINIINNEVYLSISELEYKFQIWIRDNGIEVIPASDPLVTLTLSENDLEALIYLFKMKDREPFIWTVESWIEAKEKAKQQKNQFEIVSERIKQDMKEINEILKRCEKLLSNLPI